MLTALADTALVACRLVLMGAWQVLGSLTTTSITLGSLATSPWL